MSAHPTTHNRTASTAVIGSVEWEEMPVMAHVVLRRHLPTASFAIADELVREAHARLRSEPRTAPVWTETMPAIFDPLIPSAPLAGALRMRVGTSLRDVYRLGWRRFHERAILRNAAARLRTRAGAGHPAP